MALLKLAPDWDVNWKGGMRLKTGRGFGRAQDAARSPAASHSRLLETRAVKEE